MNRGDGPFATQEGMTMKTIGRFVHLVGRFAVGVGIGVALVSAFVIVTTDIGGEARRAKPAEIVHLDPIVVTISAERYAATASELQDGPKLARTPNRGVIAGEG